MVTPGAAIRDEKEPSGAPSKVMVETVPMSPAAVAKLAAAAAERGCGLVVVDTMSSPVKVTGFASAEMAEHVRTPRRAAT
jgi:hypothetical protein